MAMKRNDAVDRPDDHRPRVGRHQGAEHPAAALVALDVLRLDPLGRRVLGRCSRRGRASAAIPMACSATTSARRVDESWLGGGQAAKPNVGRIAQRLARPIKSDPDLLNFALAGGRAAFNENCAACHGRRRAGRPADSRRSPTTTGSGAASPTRSSRPSARHPQRRSRHARLARCRPSGATSILDAAADQRCRRICAFAFGPRHDSGRGGARDARSSPTIAPPATATRGQGQSRIRRAQPADAIFGCSGDQGRDRRAGHAAEAGRDADLGRAGSTRRRSGACHLRAFAGRRPIAARQRRTGDDGHEHGSRRRSRCDEQVRRSAPRAARRTASMPAASASIRRRSTGTFRRYKTDRPGGAARPLLRVPWLRWDRGPGLPDQAVLIDFPARRVYFFGLEIWPQQFYYLTGS